MGSVLFGYFFASGIGRRIGKAHPASVAVTMAAAAEWAADEAAALLNMGAGALAAREAAR